MIKWIFLILLHHVADLNVLCFNIDVNNPIIYFDQTKYSGARPSNKSSYFGYSVILYSGNNFDIPWVQIGAPKANSPNVHYENPGTVFECSIAEGTSTSNPCRIREVDTAYGIQNYGKIRYTNKFDGAMIGSVMDISFKSNRTVVCAPRWINVGLQDYYLLGACYWSIINDPKYFKELPLITYGTGPVGIRGSTYSAGHSTVYNFGQGEAGFSAHIVEDGTQLLLGTPGVFNWRGSIALLRDAEISNGDPISSRYTSGSPKTPTSSVGHIFHDDIIPNSVTSAHASSFGLLGYSVTSGNFYSKNFIHYVAGAPRSAKYKGEVFLFRLPRRSDEELKPFDSLQGHQFGEYFGASLAAGDIDGDGLDDLFVGAPFKKTSKYNEGGMYLFLGSNKKPLKIPRHGDIIQGKYVNGQFGTTITYLGDMNYAPGDHKTKYVAVSAPYEEDSGVVYIFKGSSLGIDVKPVQRIVGKSIFSNLEGFGISISKPADIDKNGYKDIAIGAYKSGHVVLLRSRPLVEITSSFDDYPRAIAKTDKEFEFTVCHKFYSFEGLERIRISRTVVVDEKFDRANLASGTKEVAELDINGSSLACEKLKVQLRSSVNNLIDPLTLKVQHEFLENKVVPSKRIVDRAVEGDDNFCMKCGVYDSARSTRTITKEIPFVLGCGNDNKCVSELTFESHFNGTGVRNDTFILGSKNFIEMVTTVMNGGEKAYSLRVQVDIPEVLSFKKTPSLCEQNHTRIICPLANPLDRNETDSLVLKLDMDNINKRTDNYSLFINVTITTHSQNKNPSFKIIPLHLKTEADITILGKSDEQSYSYGKGKESDVEFRQIFQIGKYGLSPVAAIHFDILVPYALRKGSSQTNFLSVYKPDGNLEGGGPILFTSDFEFLEENKLEGTDSLEYLKSDNTRRKRSADSSEIEVVGQNFDLSLVSGHIEEPAAESGLLGNSTFEIDCNMTEYLCKNISGSVGSFDGLKKSAIIELRMVLNTKTLQDLVKKYAVIKFSTYGFVRIEDPQNLTQSGKRPDMVKVSSLFVNDGDKKKIDLWVIIVSVILGFALLMVLTFGLSKAGFFKRAKKEELEQLKAKAQQNASESYPEAVDHDENDSTM